MDIDKYTNTDEGVVVSETVRDGKLICTDQRLIHVSVEKTTDISIPAINMTEHSVHEYNTGDEILKIIGGFLMFCGVIGVFLPGQEVKLISGLGVISGILLYYFSTGEEQRRDRLQITTPSKNLSFVSNESNLENIVHAIRAVENDQYSR